MSQPLVVRLLGPVEPALPVVLSVPHAGREWTPAMRAACLADSGALLPLEDRFADRLVDRAVDVGFTVLTCDVPRAWIDLNRAPDDLDWNRLTAEPPQPVSARAAAGIGVVPDRLPDIGPLWRAPLSRAEVARRVDAVHEPWHAKLGGLLESALARFGEVVLLDIHSMPKASSRQADIVLGTLRGRSVAAEWVHTARLALASRGRRVAIDQPYAGAHIAERHGRPAGNQHVLQIEMCRGLYLDAAAKQPSDGLSRAAEDVLAVAEAISGRLDPSDVIPLAAE